MTTTSIQEATVTMIQQSALRWRRRRGLAGNKECDSSKSDGNDEKGGGRATTATATATATRRAMVVATREAGKEEGDGRWRGRQERWRR